MDIQYLLFLQDFRGNIHDALTPFMEWVSAFAVDFLILIPVFYLRRARTRPLSFVFALFILLTMFSRNYLGVHTPQDVFTALLISLLSLFGTAKLFSYLEKNPEKEDWLLLSAFVFCSLALVYITFKPYPMAYTTECKLIVDPQKMMNDGYGDLGKMLGFCIARFVEKKWIRFTPLKNSLKGAVLCIVGLIPMILLKLYFSPFMKEAFGAHWGKLFFSLIYALYYITLFPIVIKCAARKTETAPCTK